MTNGKKSPECIAFSTRLCEARLNGDGTIDLKDLLLLKRQLLG